MFRFQLKLSWCWFWMLAAAGLCTVEVCATTYRGHSFLQREKRDVLPATASSRLGESDSIGTISNTTSSSTVLVVGNPNPVTDGEVEVTLRSIPMSRGNRGGNSPSIRHVVQRVSVPPPAVLSTKKPVPASDQVPQQERVYFLPAKIQATPTAADHAAIPCRLTAANPRVLIYVDQRIPYDEILLKLVTAINSASASKMIQNVERLAGSVSDLDRDGHLTVVITPQVSQLGQPNNPVYGKFILWIGLL